MVPRLERAPRARLLLQLHRLPVAGHRRTLVQPGARPLRRTSVLTSPVGIPYKVVNIVSGELNDAAAKKYDLEA